MVVVYVVQKVYLRTSRQLRFIELESRAAVFSSFLESVGNIRPGSGEVTNRNRLAASRLYELLGGRNMLSRNVLRVWTLLSAPSSCSCLCSDGSMLCST